MPPLKRDKFHKWDVAYKPKTVAAGDDVGEEYNEKLRKMFALVLANASRSLNCA
jgi:hypothetical protein